MKGIARFIQKFGSMFLEIGIGGTFVWFGSLLISGTTPLLPFFQAVYPRYAKAMFMSGFGVYEVVLGALILLPLLFGSLKPYEAPNSRMGNYAKARLPKLNRLTLPLTIAFELLYLLALVGALLFSSAHVFAPGIPHVTTFGYFVLLKLLVVMTALVLTSGRFPSMTNDTRQTTND